MKFVCRMAAEGKTSCLGEFCVVDNVSKIGLARVQGLGSVRKRADLKGSQRRF